MGVDFRIAAIRGPADERWEPMFQALQAVRAADLPVPQQIIDYFEMEDPDSPSSDPSEHGIELYHGVNVMRPTNLPEWAEWVQGEWGGWVVIDLSKLPEGVTHLKAWMS